MMNWTSRVSRSILAIVEAGASLLSTDAPADATSEFYVDAGTGNSSIKQDFPGNPSLRTLQPATDPAGRSSLGSAR
jgi:hypothetical protein